MTTRPAAVAGTWYPGTPGALQREVDAHVQAADISLDLDVRAIVTPHAGLMFSGAVAACAHKAAAARAFDVVVLVGPSHFVAFDGVALYSEGAFASPLGDAIIDVEGARRVAAAPIVRPLPSAHQREHSLEMQLPFLRRLLPEARIVPLLIGYQTRETIVALSEALAEAFPDPGTLLVASTDLSHFFDAPTAQALDRRVQDYVSAFDAEGLLDYFGRYPEHERGRYVACGGGAMIAVMMAARALGATVGRVLRYGHSGDVSGDDARVVGYMAAAFGRVADAGGPG